jgi:hypothetical protein
MWVSCSTDPENPADLWINTLLEDKVLLIDIGSHDEVYY